MKLLITIACCCFVTVLHAQKYECPLRNGVVLKHRHVGLIPPHSDERMDVYSTVDSVFSVASGEVFGVLDHSPKSHSVVVKIDSTTTVAYAFMHETFLKKGDRLKTGDYIGRPEPFEEKFRLSLRLFKGSTQLDPKAFCNCDLEE